MAFKVSMPEMGEGVIEGTISQWLKKVGDKVQQFEPILEIETDKVTTEATADEAGTLLEILVPAGQTVEVGTLLAVIGEPGEQIVAADVQEDRADASPDAPHSSGAKPEAFNGRVTASGSYTGRVSPVVGRIAAEHEVDLNHVSGTGREGRITKKDILDYLDEREYEEAASDAAPTSRVPAVADPVPPLPLSPQPLSRQPVDPDLPSVEGELVPLSNMRRAIAQHMVASKRTSPHVTTFFEFDFSAVAAHRAVNKAQFAKDGANLTVTAYLVSAMVQALKAHPMVNSSWHENGIVLRPEINIGMAAAIQDGLIVPVIKSADSMNLLGLARVINRLTQQARSNQLKPGDVQGGTFTITNHGTTGSLFATPIINQPQCGIFGVGKIEKRVKVINDAIAIRPLAYVSFTFDHRILDGATADGFVSTVKDVIENWPM